MYNINAVGARVTNCHIRQRKHYRRFMLKKVLKPWQSILLCFTSDHKICQDRLSYLWIASRVPDVESVIPTYASERFSKTFWSAQFVLIYAYSRYLGYSTPASSAMTNTFFTVRKALLSTGLDSKVFLEWRHLKDILIRWHHAEGINLSCDFLYCNKEKDF